MFLLVQGYSKIDKLVIHGKWWWNSVTCMNEIKPCMYDYIFDTSVSKKNKNEILFLFVWPLNFVDMEGDSCFHFRGNGKVAVDLQRNALVVEFYSENGGF